MFPTSSLLASTRSRRMVQVVPSSVWTKTTAATAAKYGNHIARQQQQQQQQHRHRSFSCRLATLAKTASTTTPSSLSLSSLSSPLQVFHLPRSTPPQQQQHLQHLMHLQQQQHRWLSSDATKSTSEGRNGGAGAGDATQASTAETAEEDDDKAAAAATAAAAEAAAESEMDNTTTTTTTTTMQQQQDQLHQQQIDELQKQAQVTKDQLLRSLAEQENIRSIARRDVDAARQFSIKSFAKALLDVADNLERALSHIDKVELESNQSLKTLYEGIDMTSTGLTKALESNGVKAYCHEPGDTFDPTLHEALMEFHDPSKPPGTVGLVMKKGYMLNNRVLRPAEVGVIKK